MSSNDTSHNKKTALLPFVILLAGALLVWFMLAVSEKEKKTPKVVELPAVEVRALVLSKEKTKIFSQSTLKASKEVTLLSEVSGKIKWISKNFDEGARFKKGESLVKIDSRDYELKMQQARAQLNEAQQVLLSEKAKTKIAIEEWKSLSKAKLPSLVSNPLSLQSAITQGRLMQIALEIAERNLQRCDIKAPFDGAIRRSIVDEGQVITINSQLGEIFSIDSFELRLPLSNKDLGAIIENGSVIFHYLYGGKKYQRQGKLDRIEAEVDARSRVFHVVAKIAKPYDFKKDSAPLRLGMFVKAEIEGVVIDNVTVIDSAYVKEGRYAWVVDDKKTLRRRGLDIAFSSGEQTWIRSGFETGDRLCLTLLNNMKGGLKVRVK